MDAAPGERLEVVQASNTVDQLGERPWPACHFAEVPQALIEHPREAFSGLRWRKGGEKPECLADDAVTLDAERGAYLGLAAQLHRQPCSLVSAERAFDGGKDGLHAPRIGRRKDRAHWSPPARAARVEREGGTVTSPGARRWV